MLEATGRQGGQYDFARTALSRVDLISIDDEKTIAVSVVIGRMNGGRRLCQSTHSLMMIVSDSDLS